MSSIFDAIKDALASTTNTINSQLGTNLQAFSDFDEVNKYTFGITGDLADVTYNGSFVNFTLKDNIIIDVNIFDTAQYNEMWALMVVANNLQQLHVASKVGGLEASMDRLLINDSGFKA